MAYALNWMICKNMGTIVPLDVWNLETSGVIVTSTINTPLTFIGRGGRTLWVENRCV
jgi:hypothetical protein